MKLVIAIASAVAPFAATAAYAKDDYVYGPAPDWTRNKQLGDVAVRAALPDWWQAPSSPGLTASHLLGLATRSPDC